MIETTHIPKGGMCAVCAHNKEDCSHLPFHRMKPIEVFDDLVVVRCSAWRRVEPQAREVVK